MFLDLIENVPNEQDGIYERILSHQLPIIVYGTGDIATRVTEKMSCKGIEIAGYAVDTPYLQTDRFMGKPVYDFEEIKKVPERYVFVSGIGDAGEGVPLYQFIIDKSIIHYTISKPDVDHEMITYDFLTKHLEEFERTYDWLEDEASRKTFVAYLNLKISGNVLWNYHMPRAGRQYFNNITQMYAGGVLLDCGAYKGDTIKEFIEWSGGEYKKIFAVEASAEYLKDLKRNISENDWQNVKVIPLGAWDKAEKLYFGGSFEGTKQVSVTGNSIQVDTIDNMIGKSRIDFLKMDIEGSELPALHGAAKILKRDMPAIAVCVYHKASDLIDIPRYIKSFENEKMKYRFFLRKHHLSTESELVLYCIPVSL